LTCATKVHGAEAEVRTLDEIHRSDDSLNKPVILFSTFRTTRIF
jgi:hypothetical protein